MSPEDSKESLTGKFHWVRYKHQTKTHLSKWQQEVWGNKIGKMSSANKKSHFTLFQCWVYLLQTDQILQVSLQCTHYPPLIHLLNTSEHPAVNFPKTEALVLSKVLKLISFIHTHTHTHMNKVWNIANHNNKSKHFHKVKSSSFFANCHPGKKVDEVNCFSKSTIVLTENSTYEK